MERSSMHWPSFLRELDMTERSWNTRATRYPREDAVPMLPYPMPGFITLLTDAVMSAPVRMTLSGPAPARFLDVGAGPGVKVRMAQALFGLDAHGIELVPEFAAEAQSHGADVTVADAFAYDGYSRFDIVYVNRPSTQIAELEATVMDGMAPGAVLMMVNGQGDPGKAGWTLVSQEWGEPIVGVWVKP